MTHHHATTLAVGEHKSFACQMPSGFDGMGAIEHQPCFAPVTRRELLTAVNTAARDLGLRATSVMVIDALLSCLPCKDLKTSADISITPLTLLTVYASNSTLCFRAKGIADRQLRRHLERLEEIGLIRRRDSANGKRFPIKRDGRVVGAFGIDLSPLLARSGELLALAEKRRQQTEELRGLKACIQTLRLKCLQLRLDDVTHAFVEGAQTILRRITTTVTQARDMADKLRDILAEAERSHASQLEVSTTANTHPEESACQESAASDQMSATDGQNDRHKESIKSDTKKGSAETFAEFWKRLPEIAEFFPEVPRTEHGIVRVIFEFGKMLRIGQNTLAEALQILGPMKTLTTQEKIASRADRILNPDGYLARLIESALPLATDRGRNPWCAP